MLDFPLWLRATHFLNLLFLSLLVRSGLEILSAHPKLYWNDDCTPGSEWLRLTRKRLPEHELWTSRDEETSFSSWIALPGRNNLGLGRHWHFLADAGWLLTGLLYVVDALRHARMAPIDSDAPGRFSRALGMSCGRI